MKGPFQIANSV